MDSSDELIRILREFSSQSDTHKGLSRRAEIARENLYGLIGFLEDAQPSGMRYRVRKIIINCISEFSRVLLEYGGQKSKQDMLKMAVDGYESILEITIQDRNIMPEDYARTRMKHAQACQLLGELGDENGQLYLQIAVMGYGLALKVMRRDTMPGEWSETQVGRASALERMGSLSGGVSGIKYLQQAVEGYSAALTVITRKKMPRMWAIVQINRADALQKLGEWRGGVSGSEDLQKALEGYNDALTIVTRKTMQEEWVMIQINRATVLQRLSDMSGGSLCLGYLRAALEGYASALTIITCENMQGAWILANMNRANAFQSLVDMSKNIVEQERYIQSAIDIFNNLLKFFDDKTMLNNFDMVWNWAMVQMNRANALQRLGKLSKHGADLDHFRESLDGYEAALTVMTSEATPADWSQIQLNKSISLFYLGKLSSGSSSEKYFQAALDACDAALTIRSYETMPAAWGRVQMNRLVTLQALGALVGGAAGRAHLLEAMSISLILRTFYKEAGQTGLFLQATRHAILTNLKLEDWNEAARIAQEILGRVDELLFEVLSSMDLSERIGQVTGIGDRAAFALAKQGRLGEAVLAAEVGRAHQLREHLRLAEAGLSVDARSRFDQRRFALDQARRALQLCQNGWSPAMNAGSRAHANADIDAKSETLRHEHRAYLELLDSLALRRREAPDFSVVVRAAGIGEGGAIVIISVTETGSVGLVIPHSSTDPGQIVACFMPAFQTGTLDHWLQNDVSTGWLDDYSVFSREIANTSGRDSRDGAWNNRVLAILESLWHDLMAPIDATLRGMGLRSGAEVTLVLPGLLSVLPLHAAGIYQDGRWHGMLDNWSVAYAPGLAALVSIGDRQYTGLDRLLAVTDPRKDLHISYNAARDFFAQVCEYRGEYATREAVVAELSCCSHASFLCHGKWHPVDPERSGLLLAAEELLTPADILAAGMPRCRFVMLGACESGLVSIKQTPDELQGLPVAMLQAGAGAVAATFWPIYNHTADLIIAEVFRLQRQEHLRPAVALRQTLLRLRNGDLFVTDSFFSLSRDRDMSQPMHWAAIGLFGR